MEEDQIMHMCIPSDDDWQFAIIDFFLSDYQIISSSTFLLGWEGVEIYGEISGLAKGCEPYG